MKKIKLVVQNNPKKEYSVVYHYSDPNKYIKTGYYILKLPGYDLDFGISRRMRDGFFFEIKLKQKLTPLQESLKRTILGINKLIDL